MTRPHLLLCIGLHLMATASAAAREDVLIADFEGDTYGAWQVTGEAFGTGPARGTLPNQMAVDGYRGRGLVNSFLHGDAAHGSLTSPPFQIERRHISFLIGGGKSDQLVLQLLVDDHVVRSATGGNDRSGGSESLEPASWDVAEFAGRTAILRVLDEAEGGWGHLNVDHIVQTDAQPVGFQIDRERVFTTNARYLHLPIRNGAPRRSVTLLVDGRPVVRNDIEIADAPDAAVDWWATLDVGKWPGAALTIRVDRLRDDSKWFELIEPGDQLKDAAQLYAEPLRGQFHFSPRRGWNNDPNGLVYYNGEYHLFFQHNPYGWSWGNMHWGHAVSRDLVHWEELGDVLLPDEMGPMFSGSAVVDWQNTSGFGKDGQPPLVLIYTAAGNPTVQAIAYSNDGRTFAKYAGNPVLAEITPGNRDPKVFWHAPTGKWVMTLYVEWQGRHTIHFFTSPDLKAWTLASITPGDGTDGRYLFECPDFFALPVLGNDAQQKWVLWAANSQYALGDFDGTRFAPEATHLTGHRGQGFYAAQTFSDTPDGRRLLIGWWQTETRGMPFNQSMTVPLELQLKQTKDGPRLTFKPVAELDALRTRRHLSDIKTLAPGDPNPLSAAGGELLELRATFTPGTATSVVFHVRGVPIEYDALRQELTVAGHRASAPLSDGRQQLIVYCDRTGFEIFASDGLCYLPLPHAPNPEQLDVSCTVQGGTVEFDRLEVFELNSAWARH